MSYMPCPVTQFIIEFWRRQTIGTEVSRATIDEMIADALDSKLEPSPLRTIEVNITLETMVVCHELVTDDNGKTYRVPPPRNVGKVQPQCDYPKDLKHYSEAIRRNPEDAKLYSNRAACCTKLAEFQLGLKDCDECFRLDPTCIKGFIRKGTLLLALKETSKAAVAYRQAMELDPNNQEALDGFRRCSMAQNSDPEEVRKRAMSDPEVQKILTDPAMRLTNARRS